MPHTLDSGLSRFELSVYPQRSYITFLDLIFSLEMTVEQMRLNHNS